MLLEWHWFVLCCILGHVLALIHPFMTQRLLIIFTVEYISNHSQINLWYCTSWANCRRVHRQGSSSVPNSKNGNTDDNTSASHLPFTFGPIVKNMRLCFYCFHSIVSKYEDTALNIQKLVMFNISSRKIFFCDRLFVKTVKNETNREANPSDSD